MNNLIRTNPILHKIVYFIMRTNTQIQNILVRVLFLESEILDGNCLMLDQNQTRGSNQTIRLHQMHDAVTYEKCLEQ